MEVIQINKPAFDRIFREILVRLELDKLKRKESIADTSHLSQPQKVIVEGLINDMHRKTHYEISCLKDRLEKQ